MGRVGQLEAVPGLETHHVGSIYGSWEYGCSSHISTFSQGVARPLSAKASANRALVLY